MKKHPSSFKLTGYLAERLKLIGDEPLTLYEGVVDPYHNHVILPIQDQ